MIYWLVVGKGAVSQESQTIYKLIKVSTGSKLLPGVSVSRGVRTITNDTGKRSEAA